MRRILVVLGLVAGISCLALGVDVNLDSWYYDPASFPSVVYVTVLDPAANVNPALPEVIPNGVTITISPSPAGTGRSFDAVTIDVVETGSSTGEFIGMFTLDELADLSNLTAGGYNGVDDVLEVFPGDEIFVTYNDGTVDYYDYATVIPRLEFPLLAAPGDAIDYGAKLTDQVMVYDWSANEQAGAIDERIDGLWVEGSWYAYDLQETAADTGCFELLADDQYTYLDQRNYFEPGGIYQLEYWGWSGAALGTMTLSEQGVDLYLGPTGEYGGGYTSVVDALAHANDNSAIYIWPATYIENTWFLEHPIEIYGAGPQSTVIRFDMVTDRAVAGTRTPDSWLPDIAIMADDIRIEGLTLDFDGGDGTHFSDRQRAGGGIIAKSDIPTWDAGPTDGPQKNLAVEYCIIYVGNTTYGPLQPNQCAALQTGLWGNPSGLEFSHNTVYVNGPENIPGYVGNADGVFINPGTNTSGEPELTITDNTFIGNIWHGVYVDSATYVVIADNTFDVATIPANANDSSIKVLNRGAYGVGQKDIFIFGNVDSGSAVGIRLMNDSAPGTSQGCIFVAWNTIADNEIGILVGAGVTASIYNNAISGNNVGVQWESDAPSYFHCNNIEGNAAFGVNNTSGVLLDANLNWWGDASGPSGGVAPYDYTGSGDTVSELVRAEPWLPGGYVDLNVVYEGTATGTDIVDAGWSPNNVQVIKTGSGTPDVAIAQYATPPGNPGFEAGGFYVDVWLSDATNVDSVEIRFFTADPTVVPRWFDGTTWLDCSDYAYNPGGGYLAVTVTATSIPSLSDLTGTPFGFGVPIPGAEVIISDATMLAGGVGTAVLSVANIPAPGVSDLQLWVTFDNTKFAVQTPSSLLGGYDIESFTPIAEANASGQIGITMANTSGAGYVIGDADLLAIPFVGIGGPGDSAPLVLTVDVLRTPEGGDIFHTITDGEARILATLSGDVNGDGSVDVTDARWAAEYAIGIRTLTAAQIAAADVAPPPGVDITDARWIAEAAIGLRTLSLMAVVPTGRIEPASIEVNAFGELVVSGTNAELADLQGTLYFDPNEVRITSVSGLNGFEVLASQIDNEAGYVKFAAAKLHGGMITGGPILAFETSGDASVGLLDLDVFRDAKGRDIPFDVLNAGVGEITEFGCYPNPVQDVHTTHFSVKGTLPIDQIRVYIYDFSGGLVYDSGWGPNDLAWHLQNDAGDVLANGVYYYRMEVLFIGSDKPVVTKIGKVAIYR